MLKNNKAALPVVMLVSMGLMGAIITSGFVETAKSGVLKKNGQTIWCKMQNKGNDFCDARYR